MRATRHRSGPTDSYPSPCDPQWYAIDVSLRLGKLVLAEDAATPAPASGTAAATRGGIGSVNDSFKCTTDFEFGLILALLTLTAGYVYQEVHQAITTGWAVAPDHVEGRCHLLCSIAEPGLPTLSLVPATRFSLLYDGHRASAHVDATATPHLPQTQACMVHGGVELARHCLLRPHGRHLRTAPELQGLGCRPCMDHAVHVLHAGGRGFRSGYS